MNLQMPDPAGAADVAPRQRDVAFAAQDGFPLNATLIEGDGDGPLALISGATGVPRGFYAKFAAALVQNGAGAALCYDYRGMPGSPKPNRWRERLRMKHWGTRDLPAALDVLRALDPNRPVIGIGQSFGGQALGICGRADAFERYAMIAVLSGHWRHLGHPLRDYLMMNAVALPLTLIVGRTLPFMGLGDAIPAPIFSDWARWCRSRDYYMSDPGVPETAGLADVRTPILCVRHPDDHWGTERAVEAMMAFYVNAPIERVVLGPDQAGGRPVGHLGFFRSRFADTLWPPVIDWLLNGPSTDNDSKSES